MSENDMKDRLIVFQLSKDPDEPRILVSSDVEPEIEGASDAPDVLAKLEMLSFHVGAGEDINRKTRATLRIDFGNDELSASRGFEPVSWSIVAGLDLYRWTREKPKARDLAAAFREVFAKRPIEIPGGLGSLSFAVAKHPEKKWWRKIFDLVRRESGRNLISVLGLPAIARAAIEVLDELLEKIEASKPQVLFRSGPMRLALSKKARDDFTVGNSNVKIGCLNSGICIFARGADYETIAKARAVYHTTYGILAPADVPEETLLSERYKNPLDRITYGVFKVNLKQTKLDPTFGFGA